MWKSQNKRKLQKTVNEDSESESDDESDEFTGGIQNYVGQPKCLSKDCELHPHQMDSLKWMASLYENKANGIIADDMGMGKTIQAISFLAYLRESIGIKN